MFAVGSMQVCGMSALLDLHELTYLNLGWCCSVCDADAEALAALTQLRELTISHTKVDYLRALVWVGGEEGHRVGWGAHA